MPEYLTPGVYVEEVAIGPKPIEGVSTSTAGFIGETERGPVSPMLIGGSAEYFRIYGGYKPESYLTYAVEGFFANGGKRCIISRVIGKGGKCAQIDLMAAKDNPTRRRQPAPSEDKEEKKTPEKGPEDEAKEEKPGSNLGSFIVEAVGPGLWGNNVAVKIEDASLWDEKRNPDLFKMTLLYWKASPPSAASLGRQTGSDVSEPTFTETYDNLSIKPTSSDYCVRRINESSVLVNLNLTEVGEEPPQKGVKFLAGGHDGAAASLGDYVGDPLAEPGERTGLLAFTEIDEISIVCVPDESKIPGLTDAIVGHCETMKDRFAILQAAEQAGKVTNLRPPTDSKYAAFYYPWIKVIDPLTRMAKPVPPGGHVAGIYARSDIERGVHKAPANEVIRGAIGLQLPITKTEQDILNPRGVNCIRVFATRGIRVWGARTVSSDPEWKYVNVRRLFLFLEESIEEGTQWVVFEPNDERLWARVRQTVTNFLTRVWKDGALMGTTPDQAFFVKCDRTTMTQDDIDNGRIIIMIGVAPVKPAEFVIFRIAQKPGGGEVSE